MRKSLPPLWIYGGPLGLLLLVVLFLVDILSIQGSSMEPDLRPGQTIFVFKAAYGLHIPIIDRYLWIWNPPKVGDVVVLRHLQQKNLTIKRCIGISGDRVYAKDGVLRVRDYKLPIDSIQSLRWEAEQIIPPGMIFVAGDNLPKSKDSRDLGWISIEDILGKMVF